MGSNDHVNGDAESPSDEPADRNEIVDVNELRREIDELKQQHQTLNSQRRRFGQSKRATQAAKGMYWGTLASSAAMQFVIPSAIGYWIDSAAESAPVGLVIGSVIGFGLGIRGLLRLANQMDNSK